jgi:SAM-dependent methyltransferase
MSFKKIFSRVLEQVASSFATGKKVVIDLPAGNGETSRYLQQKGFEVHAFDLFPEFFSVDGLQCQFCDVVKGIPFPDKGADLIICQEGIEHFSDQMVAFREFNRVLRKHGKLVLTTPNHSSLKSKISYLLNESEKHSRIMPVNEFDSIWFNRNDNENQYYGHVFLIGIAKLRLFGKLAGFKVSKIYFSELKPSNLLLFVIFYPFIVLTSLANYRRNVKKKPYAKETYLEMLKLNLSPKILMDGSLIVEFEKEFEVAEAKKALYQIGNYDLTT